MKVSVIVPIYNVEKWLGKCLLSLEMQTLEECEFILVDDGSTDSSPEIIASFVNRDSRFISISQKNMGLSNARNTGMDKACGEYIVFLDGDDEYRSVNLLETLYDLAIQTDADFITFDSIPEYENDDVRKDKYVSDYLTRSREYGYVSSGKELFFQMYENNDFCVMVWLLFINSKWMKYNNIRFVDGLIHEDNLFTFLCFMNADGGVYHLHQDFHTYNIRSGSISVSKPTIRDVYSFLFTLKMEMAYISEHSFSVREQELLIKHLDPIREMAKDKYGRLAPAERAKVYGLPCIEYFIFKSINAPGFLPAVDVGVHVEGYFGIIAKSEKVAIYGIGMVGKNLYRYMNAYGLTNIIDTFLVSQEIGITSWNGIPIKELDKAEMDKETLIVIAVTEQYRRDIVLKLCEKGLPNLLITDDLMINYMNYCTG